MVVARFAERLVRIPKDLVDIFEFKTLLNFILFCQNLCPFFVQLNFSWIEQVGLYTGGLHGLLCCCVNDVSWHFKLSGNDDK